MIGGGAQIIVFTSGRGTPTGFPFAPVIKVKGNDGTFDRMRENIDLNTGDIISAGVSIEEKGRELFELVVRVASGEQTKAELLMHDELFCVTRVS